MASANPDHTAARHAVLRRLRKTRRRIASLEQDLAANRQWEKAQHEAELLQANFHLLKRGQRAITVTDWATETPLEISLDPVLTPRDQVAARFKLARKQKRSLPYLEKELDELRVKEEEWAHWLEVAEAAGDLSQLPIAPQPPPRKPGEPPPPFRRYTSGSGLEILVGKNAQENQLLTFTVANGRDWWFHVEGFSGSHVVIRLPKGGKPDQSEPDQSEPDQAAIEQACELAKYYSQARRRADADIVYTQVKNLRKGKRTGEVLVSGAYRAAASAGSSSRKR